MKLFTASLFLWFVAYVLDLWSTIIQSPTAEENPVMRWIWQTYQDNGLVIANTLAAISVIFIVTLTYRRSRFIPISLLILSAFKILIAFTNFGIAPYYLTAWFHY